MRGQRKFFAATGVGLRGRPGTRPKSSAMKSSRTMRERRPPVASRPSIAMPNAITSRPAIAPIERAGRHPISGQVRGSAKADTSMPTTATVERDRSRGEASAKDAMGARAARCFEADQQEPLRRPGSGVDLERDRVTEHPRVSYLRPRYADDAAGIDGNRDPSIAEKRGVDVGDREARGGALDFERPHHVRPRRGKGNGSDSHRSTARVTAPRPGVQDVLY